VAKREGLEAFNIEDNEDRARLKRCLREGEIR